MNAAYFDAAQLMTIYAAAGLIGLASGVLAIEWATSGRPWSWFRVVAGGVLTAGFAILVAARPDFARITCLFWAIAAGGMAVIDLGVVCLLDPFRPRRRFSLRAARRITVGLPVAAAVVLAAMAGSFDFNGAAAVGMAASVATLATADAIVRLVAIRLNSRRRPVR